MRAEAEEPERGEREGDSGQAEQRVPGDGRQHGGQECVAQDVPTARAQTPGGGHMQGGTFLTQQRGGVCREGRPGERGDGEGGCRRSAARDGGDQQRCQDRRYGVHRVDERPGDPGQQPEQYADSERDGADREGEQEGVDGTVGDPREQIPAERVGAERVGPGGVLEPQCGVEGERIAGQAERDDTEEEGAVHNGRGASAS